MVIDYVDFCKTLSPRLEFCLHSQDIVIKKQNLPMSWSDEINSVESETSWDVRWKEVHQF